MRQAQLTLFPTTPGEWLRCFRLGAAGGGESDSSLERLSWALGVSSRTIRRWESGNAQPSQHDLQRFAACLRLSALHRLFLLRAFSNMRFEAVTAPTAGLHRQAEPWLAHPVPALLLDRLFYVCAWNSAAELVEPHSDACPLPPHYIGRVLTLPVYRESAQDFRALVRGLLQTMWIGTGRTCGSAGYIDMLTQLADIPGFCALWRSLVLDDGAAAGPACSSELAVPGVGRFRLIVSKIELPPTYYLVQWLPADATAWASVNARYESSPSRVFCRSRLE